MSQEHGLAWLGTAHSSFLLGPATAEHQVPERLLDQLERLAALDRLHAHQQLLREGWVFVVGRTEIDGARREVCLPLLSAPISLRDWGPATRAVFQKGLGIPPQLARRLGDPEITPLVADADARADLERRAQFGGGGLDGGVDASSTYLARFTQLKEWIREVTRAAGLEIDDILPPETHPRVLRRRDGLVAVVGSGIYVSSGEEEPDRRRTLRAWAARPGLDDTALAAVYAGTSPAEPPDEPERSPFPLTAAQRELVVRSRHERLTVASGAPGTGKSHAVAAVAVDAVLRGESVLVATQSPHAADVLADLLDRHPGPTPLQFGNGERRTELLDELTARLGQPLRQSELDRLDDAVRSAVDELEAALHPIHRLLGLEADSAALARWEPAIPALQADVPGAFAASTDLDALHRLCAAVAAGPGAGWLAGWRHRRAERRLRRIAGASESLPLTVLRDALAAARARRAAAQLAAHGGVSIGRLWERVVDAEGALRSAVGDRAAAHDRIPASWTGSTRRAVAALLGALRAGRGQRRLLLAALDREALTRSVPLWVGNLHDIEDLLPPIPALFDLVVLDEASQIDQPHAALALLRGRRAVVVGDPRQLRHVSFLADADVGATLHGRGIAHLADRLDLRRVSAFDAAAASSPVTWLDEHHRSVPHLIEFSARRFYRGQVRLLTRHPATEVVDAIDVERVAGSRGDDGVNREELEAALRQLDGLRSQGWTSVGIVTPFRAQADAIEAAVLDRLGVGDIEALGLRVGTVHAFQGNERDMVLLSLALDDSSLAASRRFVEDPNLFNVMVTRARRRLRVLTSLTAPDGLLGDYLSWAEAAPPRPEHSGASSPWVAALGREIERTGCPVRYGYPVGRWEIDLVAGDGDDAVAVECGVHLRGADHHVERHLALRAAGWTVVDAFPSRWDGNAAAAALDLLHSLPVAGDVGRPG